MGRLDPLQRRFALSAVTVAVFRKFSKDGGGRLAALIAYFGFFSLFPLLLVLVTISGWLLQGHPQLQAKIATSAVAEFPIVGAQIRDNITALGGSLPAVIVGLVLALWAGLGVAGAALQAMDAVWDVPQRARPSFVTRAIRELTVLLTMGPAVVAVGALGAWTASASFPWTILGGAGALALNVGLFLVAYRQLTVEDLSWRHVAPGAVLGGTLWTVALAAGSFIVGRNVRGASEVYGFFAVVIGTLSWIYLGAQITVLCAELNVVLARGLWPSSLASVPGRPGSAGSRDYWSPRTGTNTPGDQMRADERGRRDDAEPPTSEIESAALLANESAARVPTLDREEVRRLADVFIAAGHDGGAEVFVPLACRRLSASRSGA